MSVGAFPLDEREFRWSWSEPVDGVLEIDLRGYLGLGEMRRYLVEVQKLLEQRGAQTRMLFLTEHLHGYAPPVPIKHARALHGRCGAVYVVTDRALYRFGIATAKPILGDALQAFATRYEALLALGHRGSRITAAGERG